MINFSEFKFTPVLPFAVREKTVTHLRPVEETQMTISKLVAVGAVCGIACLFGIPSHAQTQGETRCGAGGTVERYSEYQYYGAPARGSWSGTTIPCAQNGGGRGNNNVIINQGNSGGPYNGETRCGANGKVQTFDARRQSWDTSFTETC
jgi:hypothetical protein